MDFTSQSVQLALVGLTAGLLGLIWQWLRSSWDTLQIQGGAHLVWPNLSKPILLRFDRFDDTIQEHAESMCCWALDSQTHLLLLKGTITDG